MKYIKYISIVIVFILSLTNKSIVYASTVDLYNDFYNNVITNHNLSIDINNNISNNDLLVQAETFLGLYATDTIYFGGFGVSSNHILFCEDDMYSGLSEYELNRRKNEIISETESILNTCINKSDIEKVSILYDYISDNTIYYSYTSNIYDLIMNHKGNCVANARTYTWLLNQVGIKSIIVHNSKHEWNQVYIDNNWYNVDVCWKDKTKYFLKSDNIFNSHHDNWYSPYLCNIDYTNYAESNDIISPTDTISESNINESSRSQSTSTITNQINSTKQKNKYQNKAKKLYTKIMRHKKSIKLKRTKSNCKLIQYFNQKYLYYYGQSCVKSQTKKYFYLLNRKQLKHAIKIKPYK